MQIRYTKGWLRDKRNQHMCHGRCPSCRGWAGTMKHEPGFKKLLYREMRFELGEIYFLDITYTKRKRRPRAVRREIRARNEERIKFWKARWGKKHENDSIRENYFGEHHNPRIINNKIVYWEQGLSTE